MGDQVSDTRQEVLSLLYGCIRELLVKERALSDNMPLSSAQLTFAQKKTYRSIVLLRYGWRRRSVKPLIGTLSIDEGCIIGSDSFWWTGICAINEFEEVISYEDRFNLGFPRKIICGVKFDRVLDCDYDEGIVGVKKDGKGIVNSHWNRNLSSFEISN
ncbi:hypothetical protein CXB51_009639 [Gossypium anomalum]|uniref:Uncharacterized protein n=1 Tax=Gossypium anomalum TaxID=47600 RepID=A0A8J5YLR6_9ROSI|nr:hypothetical protein CXB51_009639 [Gossypium anomalum]